MLCHVRTRDTRHLLAATALAGIVFVATSAGSAGEAAQLRIPLSGVRVAAKQLNTFRSHIQHIVFIIKEKRSFDMYFGAFPGADGVTSAVISTGAPISFRH